jgi:hypothetical protein
LREREEITKNEKVHDLYLRQTLFRVIKSRKPNAYKILVEKSDGKGPLGRPRFRWEDNIRKDLREIR